MITAYVDDSGTNPESQVAAAGGYLATTHQWDRFIPRWKELLDQYDVRQMHRTDLETWQGEFTSDRGWNPTRRTEFVKKAQRLIKKHTYVAVGSAIIKKDFEEVLPPQIKSFFGEYGWCVHECVIATGSWCDKVKHREPIRWVFERGTKGSGQISNYMHRCSETADLTEKTRVAPKGWTFETKDVIPLQAADVVAYEIFKQVQNQIVDKGKKDIRLSALDLFRKQEETYLKYWNRERLLRWLKEPGMQPFIEMVIRYMNSQNSNSLKLGGVSDT